MLILSKHAPAAVIDIPVSTHPMGFISKINPHTKSQEPLHHSQTDSQAGVKVTNVRTYDDPNFATKETTSSCEGGTCLIKECIGANCKEIVQNEKTG